jgi:ribosomal protein S18 acetylase RimI-like enzyme
MIKAIDIKKDEMAKKVVDLQKISYEIEANLIGYYEIPTIMDTVDSIKQCDEEFYGYYSDDILVGIISYQIKENCLDICRVAVHPNYFRRGIAQSLLRFVERTNKAVVKLTVSTGLKNNPAVSLYVRNGFRKIGVEQPSEGLDLALFEKLL